MPRQVWLAVCSKCPSPLLLRREKRGSPVLLCRLYTRLPRIGPGQEHRLSPKLGSNLRGWLPSSSLKHTRTKVTHLCLDNTVSLGLWDRALRAALQVRLTAFDGFCQQLRFKGNTNPTRLQQRRGTEPCFRSHTAIIEAQSIIEPPHNSKHQGRDRIGIVVVVIRGTSHLVVEIGQNTEVGNLVIPSCLHTHCSVAVVSLSNVQHHQQLPMPPKPIGA